MASMTSPTDLLLGEVLRLPPDERARIAAEVIASLDGEPESGVEAAWTDEIERRMAQVASGTAKLVDWVTVEAELKAAVRRP